MASKPAELEAAEALEEPYNSADPESVSNARKKAGRQKKSERDILAALMTHPDGRKLLFDSIKCVLVGLPVSFDNINMTYYNLGQEHRSRLLFREIVKVAPREFQTMMEEHADEL